MTFIALDDEPLALALIEKLAAPIPDLQLLATFTDAAAAADFMQKNTLDLLLTDINMPDVSGLEFVRQLPDERPMVIFLTAYKEHAHEGFDLDVVDYLLKPVSPERFQKAMKKAADRLVLQEKPEPLPAPETSFFVFSEYVQVKITIADILFIESMGDYVKIHLAHQTKPVLTLERLKNLAARLEKQGIVRIHRSFLVNITKIEARQKSQVCVAGIWLPVGESFGKLL